MIYEPNMGFLEIALTYVCNVKCSNCCTNSTQAPTKRTEDLTLETINRFVAESVAAAYPWKWIKLHGGEPTLHAQFLPVCEALAAYKRAHNPEVELSVCSNGSRMELVQMAVAMGFTPQVSVKIKINRDVSGNMIPYVRVNESPADLGLEPESCAIPSSCGLGLNNQGFWPCSPAAGAARVFHYETPITSVAGLTRENLSRLLAHCGHCGFSVKRPRSPYQVSSPTWDAALKAYNETR